MTRRRKLLAMHYDDHISAEFFAEEERRLTAQIDGLRSRGVEVEFERMRRDELASRFAEVADLLAQMDVEAAWEAATHAERRILVEELIEAVAVFPDHLEVHVAGAPPLIVTLEEVGLRGSGTKHTDRLGDGVGRLTAGAVPCEGRANRPGAHQS